MNDRLVFRVHGSEQITSELVRLDQDAIEILRTVQRETGMSAKKIASQMIRFCADKYEVIECD